MYLLYCLYVSISSYKEVNRMKYVPFMICVIVFLFHKRGILSQIRKQKKYMSTFDSKHRVCDCAGGDRVFRNVLKDRCQAKSFLLKKNA